MIPAALLLASLSLFPHQPMDLTLRLPITVLRPVSRPSVDTRRQRIIRTALYVIGAGLDIHSTNRAMHTPGMAEQHSWLYGKHPSLARLTFTKTVLGVSLLKASNKAATVSRVDGMMPVAISASWQTYAGLMNYRLIHKVRDEKGPGK